jgi:hypothetical protein
MPVCLVEGVLDTIGSGTLSLHAPGALGQVRGVGVVCNVGGNTADGCVEPGQTRNAINAATINTASSSTASRNRRDNSGRAGWSNSSSSPT